LKNAFEDIDALVAEKKSAIIIFSTKKSTIIRRESSAVVFPPKTATRPVCYLQIRARASGVEGESIQVIPLPHLGCCRCLFFERERGALPAKARMTCIVAGRGPPFNGGGPRGKTFFFLRGFKIWRRGPSLKYQKPGQQGPASFFFFTGVGIHNGGKLIFPKFLFPRTRGFLQLFTAWKFLSSN